MYTALSLNFRYPLIIKVEQHLTVEKQKEMVILFKEYFKDALIEWPKSKWKNESNSLPSPESLKGKILLMVKNISVVYLLFLAVKYLV